MQIAYGTSGIPWVRSLEGVEVLESGIGELKATKSEDELVLEAMAKPIDSPKLSELAKGKKTCTIIISDHTRPVPSKHIIPFMLAELRQGSPDIDVTLLVATGFHRPTSKDELTQKLGEKIVAEEKIVIHDSQDPASNVEIGVLPSGARLVIDKVAAETELLVSEGFIEPHFFAGFSGGRKSVLPGVCDQVTVLGNHCAKFIASDCARTGVLEGNPLHIDMVDAARQAKLAYIVNVIIDEDKKVGGAPLDQNMYQSVKGLTAAESAAAPGAVLIICSRCNDGTGGEGFYRALKDCESPEKLQEETLKIPMEQTNPDQWEYQILVRMMCKHHIIFVSDPSARQFVEDMKLEYAPDLETALDRAYALKGKDAHTVVIPNGISVIVEE
ncbi:Domain of uncharacterised function (DUF2088) [uncultured Flavonifractor sp.]|nr:Domain of uncharacterised function (DUF2088) [uncultured Flavonifractor sp.]